MCNLSDTEGGVKEKFRRLDVENSIDNDINEKWENIKTRVNETKHELIGKDGGTETFKNKSYCEECKLAVEEMKK